MSVDDPEHLTSADIYAPRGRISADEAAEALRKGPIGAFIIASIGAGILFIGWLALYFLLFLPRGSVG
jgi:hypothetical protein